MKAPKKASRVIRISTEVEMHLKARRRKSEPFDSTLRRLFGLATKKGEPQPLAKFFVIPDSSQPLIFLDRADARGVSMQRAVQKGLAWNKAESVLTVREEP